ncbi:variant erythrocyte surface antigen-1 family protein [Babesia caballi]|uniref:Variant erythrocyte surface antigen-1 family protein n=1 Tax=Babesia caballi TaxID=5871 RepID=A0AAV4LXQ8_BABCB|nr:variant erythrocyte surface antigen-1 family protein [Babesia caballi]
MGEKKLTEPPTNLKEAIDWITWVCGYGQVSGDYKSKLASAISDLTKFKVSFKGMFGKVEDPEGLIKGLGDGLGRGFLGYSGQGVQSFNDEGVVRSNGGYESAYRDAQWEHDQRSDYALIFLGAAYLTYFFVTLLYWRCKQGINGAWQSFTLGGTGTWLKDYMEGMGFNINSLVKDKWGYELAQLLENVDCFDEFNGIFSSQALLYYQFLQALETKAPTDAINCPLTSCYLLARDYFNLNKSSEVAGLMTQIRSTFEGFKGNQQDLHVCPRLIANIKRFLENVKKFEPSTSAPLPPQPPQSGASTTSPSSSPAVPVAGTLATFGLGGGAAAAYLFDVIRQPTSYASFSRGYPFTRLCLPRLLDRLSNLKEAIDWILRVTGKDTVSGGGAITKLDGFKETIEAAANKLTESGDGVSEGLGKLKESATLGAIIEQLTNGLRSFIGYSGGTIKHSSAGIGLPNDPRERLGDAVLGFVAGFLGGLEKFRTYVGTVTGVKPDELKRAQGKGQTVVDTAIQKVSQLNISGGNINGISNKLNQVSNFSSKNDVGQFANAVSEYLRELLEEVKKVNGIMSSAAQTPLDSLKSSLTGLVDQIKATWKSGPIDLSAIKDKISEVPTAQQSLSAALLKILPLGNNAKYVVSAVIFGTSHFLSQLKKAHHASSYKSASTWDSTVKNYIGDNLPEKLNKCAKIFLGCLPLYYQADIFLLEV